MITLQCKDILTGFGHQNSGYKAANNECIRNIYGINLWHLSMHHDAMHCVNATKSSHG